MKAKNGSQTQADVPIQTSDAGSPKRVRSTKKELAEMEKELAKQIGKGNNTIKLLMKQTGWSRQAINRRLALMVNRGQLQMVYRGRGTFYVLDMVRRRF